MNSLYNALMPSFTRVEGGLDREFMIEALSPKSYILDRGLSPPMVPVLSSAASKPLPGVDSLGCIRFMVLGFKG